MHAGYTPFGHNKTIFAASCLTARAWDVTTTMHITVAGTSAMSDRRGWRARQRRARRGRGWQRGQV
jgi:hypothetical protein